MTSSIDSLPAEIGTLTGAGSIGLGDGGGMTRGGSGRAAGGGDATGVGRGGGVNTAGDGAGAGRAAG